MQHIQALFLEVPIETQPPAQGLPLVRRRFLASQSQGSYYY